MINTRGGGNVSKQGAYHQERSGEKIEGELWPSKKLGNASNKIIPSKLFFLFCLKVKKWKSNTFFKINNKSRIPYFLYKGVNMRFSLFVDQRKPIQFISFFINVKIKINLTGEIWISREIGCENHTPIGDRNCLKEIYNAHNDANFSICRYKKFKSELKTTKDKQRVLDTTKKTKVMHF